MRHPLCRLLTISLMVLLPALAARGDKYPEPSPYPISWEFRLDHKMPKRIIVDVPGSAHPVAYWYLTYTVTNTSDAPQQFIPNFKMLTDDGRIIRSDLGVPPQVFDAIKRKEGIKLLEPASKIEGMLNVGEDQAKDGVAIWEEPLQKMGTFSIFAGGLSGEFVELKDKDGKPVVTKSDDNGQEQPVILRKTLELDYHVNNGVVRPGPDDIHAKEERWVMR
jgi:hypothetical protein